MRYSSVGVRGPNGVAPPRVEREALRRTIYTEVTLAEALWTKQHTVCGDER